MTPKRREASFRHLEFLRLSERRVLLIIVTPEGDVQNRILHTDRGVHAVAAGRGDAISSTSITPGSRSARCARCSPTS